MLQIVFKWKVNERDIQKRNIFDGDGKVKVIVKPKPCGVKNCDDKKGTKNIKQQTSDTQPQNNNNKKRHPRPRFRHLWLWIFVVVKKKKSKMTSKFIVGNTLEWHSMMRAIYLESLSLSPSLDHSLRFFLARPESETEF